MIENTNEQNKYKNINKQYIPQGYINNNWIYQYNGDYVHIITDQQCYTNYNVQYCNCINYNWKTNVMEILYQCRRSEQYSSLDTQSLTSDINYSETITNYYVKDKSMQIGIIIIGIIFAILLLKERKHI